MPTPTFTPPPTAPSRTMKPASVFNAAVAAFLGWFVTFRTELAAGVTWIEAQAATVAANTIAAAASAANALSAMTSAQGSATAAAASAVAASASAGNAAGFVSTSVTPLTVGSGVKTFTIAASKSFQPGEWVKVVDQANSANWMWAPIDSYNSGTGAMQITVAAGDFGGSGTISAWNVSLSGSKGAAGSGYTGGKLTSKLEFTNRVSIAAGATVDIGGAASNYVLVNGAGASIAALGTGGNGVLAVVEFNGVNTLVHGANLVLLGGASRATAAGDMMLVVSNGGTVWKEVAYFAASEAPGGGQIGDLILTMNGATPPGGVLADGSTLLQSAYPRLFATLKQAAAPFSAQVNRMFTKGGAFNPSSYSYNNFDTVWTGDRQAYLYSTADYASTILTTADGVTITAGGAVSTAGTVSFRRLAALGVQHYWLFNLPFGAGGADGAYAKTTDGGATFTTPTLTGYPTGATVNTVAAAGGNPATGALVIGGQKTGSAPFIATVNSSTFVMTERTLPAISGATSVFRIECIGSGRWIAMPNPASASYWLSTDDGVTWSVATFPIALSTNLKCKVAGGRFFIWGADGGSGTATYVSETGATGSWSLLPIAAMRDKINRERLKAANYGGGQTVLSNLSLSGVGYAQGTWWVLDSGSNLWGSADCKTFHLCATSLGSDPYHDGYVFSAVGSVVSQYLLLAAGSNASRFTVKPMSLDPATSFRVPNLHDGQFNPLVPYLKAA